MTPSQLIRITQILVEENWLFVDSSNIIEKLYNHNTKEEIVIRNETHLLNWLQEQAIQKGIS